MSDIYVYVYLCQSLTQMTKVLKTKAANLKFDIN